MFCRIHNTVFLAESGCNQCQTSWEDGPWETKEKEWLNKLDEIAEKAQKLSNYASGLEVDNKSLNRAIETMSRNLGEEIQAREKLEFEVSMQKTKLQAIGMGYRNALEREEKLTKQLEAVIVERGEWIERCRKSDKKLTVKEVLIEQFREKGLMEKKRKVRGWVGPSDIRSWEVHDSDCPVWLDGVQEKCDCGGGQTNYNHPHVKEKISGYPAPGDKLQFHCRGCPVWSMSNGPCSCEHCVFCGEEECICDKKGEHL